jgi:hypothetical protein
MPTVVTYLCECGTRLNIVTEVQHTPQNTTVPCPNRSCKTRHIVGGRILQVFMVDSDGQPVPYNWKVPKT